MELADRVWRGRRAIALAKNQGVDTTDWEEHLDVLLSEAGKKPSLEEGFEPWALWEWRRVSIPKWQGILDESIHNTDRQREEYARWMLREVLLDPYYEQPRG